MSILQKKKGDIPEPKPYDFKNTKSDIDACGLDEKSFEKRNMEIFTDLDLDRNENVVAVIANKMEMGLSKREVCYLLSKVTMIEMMKKAKARASGNKVKTSSNY